MSELIKLAAELVRLPTEDTPDEVYAGCKTIALKIRDYSDQLTAANAEIERLKNVISSCEWCIHYKENKC